MGHIRDRWMQPGPNGRKIRSDRWGKGLRWQVRWETPTGQRSKGLSSKDAATSWLTDQIAGVERRPVSTETLAELATRWQARRCITGHRPGPPSPRRSAR